jgi:hypothetical protein
MISQSRSYESSFRRSAGGREALASTGQGEQIHYTPCKHAGIGCITSRPKPSVTFWELLAYELGCNVTTAKELWDKGLIR